MIRTLARLAAAAGLVVAGGLTLPGGAAQAAACSGTTGVTVVIDYGSSSDTLCAADSSSAIRVLTSVASVTYPPQYQGTVVCQINDVPAQSCPRMPPGNAYWAFFHAPRGGSWTYSTSGVASYDPAPGTVIGFAFGSGGAPSSAPPAPSSTSTPKPSPSPTPKPSSSTSSTPRSTPPRPTSTGGGTPSGGATAPQARSTSATSAGSGASTHGSGTTGTATRPATTRATTSATTTPGQPTATAGEQPSPSGDDQAPQAANATDDSGSPTSLFAGLGLVGLVGAGAAYLTIRRRAHG